MYTPRRIRSEEDRNSGGGPSNYIRLGDGQRFLGYALFDGDPATDEPGYYEFYEHFDVSARRSVPCAGDECPLCADGDRPKVRAQTLWLVTRDENGNDLGDGELRIFTANWNVIKLVTEMRAEGDKIKGVQHRVSRLDDRGTYSLMPKTEKLTATQVKEWLKHDDAPDFDDMTTNRLMKAMEGYAVRKALDDDDEPEEPKKAAKKSTAKAKAETADWPEEGEDAEVVVVELDGNIITVESDDFDGSTLIYGTDEVDFTDLVESQVVTVSWVTDEEGDKVATAMEAAGAPEPEDEPNELPDAIEGERFEVVGAVDEDNGVIPVKNDEWEFNLYVLDGVDIDWDDYEVGKQITVNAERDTQGDMVASEAPALVKAAAKKAAPKAAAKTTTTRRRAAAK